ncbi:MAG TPA: hypothetical protein VM925_25305 [Labilithrix sp.]|jgi:hypothetical protein|nr:hypothetical protein [Labilithrix sp.]
MRAIALLLLLAVGACGPARRAAQQDPMRCERDPKCEKKRGRTADCSMQCSDDPACMERCEQIQAPTKLGH